VRIPSTTQPTTKPSTQSSARSTSALRPSQRTTSPRLQVGTKDVTSSQRRSISAPKQVTSSTIPKTSVSLHSQKPTRTYASSNGAALFSATDSLVSNAPPARFDSVSPIAHRDDASENSEPSETQNARVLVPTHKTKEEENRSPFTIQELDDFATRLRPLLEGIPVYKKVPTDIVCKVGMLTRLESIW